MATDSGHGVGTFKIFTRERGQREWKLAAEGHNSVMYVGMNKLISCLANPANTAYFGYIAVSNSAAAVDQTNTTLPGEVYRKAIDGITQNTTTRTVTWTATLNFSEGNGYSLAKYAFFTSLAAGTMWNETNHTSITKNSNLQVRYQYSYTLS